VRSKQLENGERDRVQSSIGTLFLSSSFLPEAFLNLPEANPGCAGGRDSIDFALQNLAFVDRVSHHIAIVIKKLSKSSFG